MDKVLSKQPAKFTASGIANSGPCVFMGFLVGCDGVNDPVITIYNGTDNTGTEVVPTSTYDASAYGLNGAVGMHVYCDKGLYVEITCAGNVEVIPQFSPYYPDGALRWRV